jgi:2-C-methyl-D-erythritol 4-phosphate cytidylyltransferase
MGEVSGPVGAIIVAAGTSSRMEGVDKVFAELNGETVLARVLAVFHDCSLIDKIVVVLATKNLERGRRLVRERDWSKVVAVCSGGSKRQDSVREGLRRLTNCDWVVIHDGARPCVNADLIQRGLLAAQETGAAVAAVPVKDTIKIVSRRRLVQQTPARSNMWIAQTPQIFRSDLVNKAYLQADDKATDDATLVEQLGHKVEVYMGSYRNMKVTTPEDLAVAEVLLRNGRKSSLDPGGTCASESATMPIG